MFDFDKNAKKLKDLFAPIDQYLKVRRRKPIDFSFTIPFTMNLLNVQIIQDFYVILTTIN